MRLFAAGERGRQLFLAFTTATAFSPTDALPVTALAKLLIMVEHAIALIRLPQLPWASSTYWVAHWFYW